MKPPHSNEGGPAFPGKYDLIYNDVLINEFSSGMSLRDWFAGMALRSLIDIESKIAAHELSEADGTPQPPAFYGDAEAWNGLAKESYLIARAMLNARNNPHL